MMHQRLYQKRIRLIHENCETIKIVSERRAGGDVRPRCRYASHDGNSQLFNSITCSEYFDIFRSVLRTQSKFDDGDLCENS